MTTQTLRGLATHGAMHWRGDRVDGFFGIDPCTQPTGAPCSEDLSFRNFIVAFEGLVGKDGTITPAQMQQFTDFVLQITLAAEPGAEARQLAHRGSDRRPRPLLRPDLGLHRDLQRLPYHGSGPGLLRLRRRAELRGRAAERQGSPPAQRLLQDRNVLRRAGDQVRGFGFLHDGSIDTVKTFVGAPVFTLTPDQRTKVEQFVLAFPSDLAPIVGQQVTLRADNGSAVNPRIDLLIARAAAPYPSLRFGGTATECDLIVKGSVGGVPRGWVREASGLFRDDTNATISDAALRALAASQGPLTYTCAPPGSGTRMGIDRDERRAARRPRQLRGGAQPRPAELRRRRARATPATRTTTTTACSTASRPTPASWCPRPTPAAIRSTRTATTTASPTASRSRTGRIRTIRCPPVLPPVPLLPLGGQLLLIGFLVGRRRRDPAAAAGARRPPSASARPRASGPAGRRRARDRARGLLRPAAARHRPRRPLQRSRRAAGRRAPGGDLRRPRGLRRLSRERGRRPGRAPTTTSPCSSPTRRACSGTSTMRSSDTRA